MPKSNCSVPFCQSGYPHVRASNKAAGKKNPSLFQVPVQNLDLFEKWCRAVKRKDRELRKGDLICELHFQKEFLVTHDVIKLENGDIFSSERVRPRLKEGSIPTIFPDAPSYITKLIQIRKPPAPRRTNDAKVIVNAEDGHKNNNIENNSIMVVTEENKIETDNRIDNYDDLCSKYIRIELPDSDWSFSTTDKYFLILYWSSSFECLKKIVVDRQLKIKAYVKDVSIIIDEELAESVNTLTNVVQRLHKLKLCTYKAKMNLRSKCKGFVQENREHCYSCSLKLVKENNIRKKSESSRKKTSRATKKVNWLKRQLLHCRNEMAKIEEKSLEKHLEMLPGPQQENVRACLQAAKAKTLNGCRYTRKWIYECLLLKIKSTATYNHLRNHKILALPSITTLRRYLRNMKPQYGFQDQVFNVMRKKANHMPMAERRGGLFIDEVKLSPNLKFDEKTLRVTGFVDLGVHTPDHQLNTPGDHALVIIYQPLQGKWFQTVGAFLSKGAAPGDVLHNIILEAIVRLENINFHVDYVTSDGATWNRAMWKYFGVSEDKPSCDHIDDSEDRKLWFISDFPHLIKNLRNWVLKVKEFMTPDGKVELSHWKVLLAINESLGLKLSPFFKLSTSHIYPQYYQKMNVGLAYYFFSDEIGTGMQYYSEFEAGLKDAEPTIKFIKRVGSLIKGMTSKRPKEALWYSEKSQALQNIKEFLHFIKDWKCTSPNQEFLTKNTYEGFCVTLASTLQLLEYLNSKIKYKYLLTTRLSQDNLENFFGMIRSAGGNADHPDPMLFIQIYRLMTTYGLMKPMRGSNVENCGELLDSLMTPSDDTDSSSNENNLTQILEECLTNQGLPEGNNERKDYSGEDVAHYVSGYVAKTTARFTKCDECASLLTEQNKDSIPNKLLKIRDHYGVLTYPSHSLFTLLKTIEDIIMSNVQREHEDDDSDEEVDDPQSEARPAKRVKLSQMNVNYDTFLNILENIKNSHLILIGCADDEHRINLTRRIVQFYSVTRMHFVIKKYNNVKFKQKEMSKEMKKKSKLQ